MAKIKNASEYVDEMTVYSKEGILYIFMGAMESTDFSYYNVSTTAPDASYGFALNSNGYYESQNKGVNNSAAVCRINIHLVESQDITFEYINYAEGTWDFAMFSKLDTPISKTVNNTTDRTNTFPSDTYHSCYNSTYNKSTVQTLTYNAVPAGDHFIEVKFRKDSSSSTNNDSLQWTITNL